MRCYTNPDGPVSRHCHYISYRLYQSQHTKNGFKFVPQIEDFINFEGWRFDCCSTLYRLISPPVLGFFLIARQYLRPMAGKYLFSAQICCLVAKVDEAFLAYKLLWRGTTWKQTTFYFYANIHQNFAMISSAKIAVALLLDFCVYAYPRRTVLSWFWLKIDF